MGGNKEEDLPELLLYKTAMNNTCHSSLVFCTACFPGLVSSPPERLLHLSLTLPAFQYFSKSPLNEKCILKPRILSFSHHTAKGNRKLHSMLAINIYNTLKRAILGARRGITVHVTESTQEGNQLYGWFLCKTVKHKSNSRDFKCPAFSWKKGPGFFLKFLRVQTVGRTSERGFVRMFK